MADVDNATHQQHGIVPFTNILVFIFLDHDILFLRMCPIIFNCVRVTLKDRKPLLQHLAIQARATLHDIHLKMILSIDCNMS